MERSWVHRAFHRSPHPAEEPMVLRLRDDRGPADGEGTFCPPRGDSPRGTAGDPSAPPARIAWHVGCSVGVPRGGGNFRSALPPDALRLLTHEPAGRKASTRKPPGGFCVAPPRRRS